MFEFWVPLPIGCLTQEKWHHSSVTHFPVHNMAMIKIDLRGHAEEECRREVLHREWGDREQQLLLPLGNIAMVSAAVPDKHRHSDPPCLLPSLSKLPFPRQAQPVCSLHVWLATQITRRASWFTKQVTVRPSFPRQSTLFHPSSSVHNQ